MTFRQHVPPMVDGVTPFEFEFDTLEELLAHSWIYQWSQDPGFYRFSLADINGQAALMQEANEGANWFVLGRLTGDVSKLGLPTWAPVYGKSRELPPLAEHKETT